MGTLMCMTKASLSCTTTHGPTPQFALIKLFNWEIFDHPTYTPDLAPSNYHLFTKMKVWLATERFHTNKSSWM
jgi:hypothetical protein